MRHQEAIEGGPAYPQEFGGLHFIAAALPKSGLDRRKIKLGGRAPDRAGPPLRQPQNVQSLSEFTGQLRAATW